MCKCSEAQEGQTPCGCKKRKWLMPLLILLPFGLAIAFGWYVWKNKKLPLDA